MKKVWRQAMVQDESGAPQLQWVQMQRVAKVGTTAAVGTDATRCYGGAPQLQWVQIQRVAKVGTTAAVGADATRC